MNLSFGHYSGRSEAQNGHILQNMMMEIDEQGGKSKYFLYMRRGLKNVISLGSGETRGIHILDGYFLAVVAEKLYKVKRDYTSSTEIGTLFTTSGFVQFIENPTQVMLCDGNKGYVFSKSDFSFSVIGVLPEIVSIAFQDGYGAAAQKGTGIWYVSGVNDFTSWDALELTTAESNPDNLLALLSDHEDMLAFGAKTIEPYVNNADLDFPFTKRAGGLIEVGIGATNSVVKGENIVFWLDNHGLVRKLEGAFPIIVSTRQIEWQISQLSTISDARGYFAVVGGHSIYILTFPTGNLTLVYDLSNQQWYKWTSGTNKWQGSCLAQDGQLILVGDFTNGTIYEFDEETYGDNSEPIYWVCTANDVYDDDFKIRHQKLTLKIETATTEDPTADEPVLWMQYSDDDGKTWSNEKWRGMGKQGEHKKIVRWRQLGEARSRRYRFSGTEQVKTVLVNLSLEAIALK